MRFLGSLKLEVSCDDNGRIEITHSTEFSGQLEMMLSTLGGDEIQVLNIMRAQICKEAAHYFMKIRDPDHQTSIYREKK